MFVQRAFRAIRNWDIEIINPENWKFFRTNTEMVIFRKFYYQIKKE